MKKQILTTLAILLPLSTASLTVSAHYPGHSQSNIPVKKTHSITTTNSTLTTDPVFYMGADVQQRMMSFEQGFGKNLTPKDYTEGNLYFGLKLNSFIGLEAGYEQSVTKNKNVTILGRDDFFNFFPFDDVNLNATNRFKTRTSIKGPHINIIGFLPINEEYRLQLIGSVGMAKLKIHIDTFQITSAGAPWNNQSRPFSKEEWIAKLSVGIQHMINRDFGARATLGWENTSRFENIKRSDRPYLLYSARVKDSAMVGLGLFYNFN